jgi:tetratricopeptide (TPR) repeat protein
MIRTRNVCAALAAMVVTAGGAAAPADDVETAVMAKEALVASGRLSLADLLKTVQALADASYRAKDYGHAVSWGQRYFKEGGTDPKMRALLSRSYYFANDFENAARGLHTEVETAEKATQPPAEDGIKLLAGCYSRLNDITGQIWALEKLVTYYPKKEHWADLIARTERRAGFSEALALDVWRLKLATGTLDAASDYLQAATLALQAGFAAEARTLLDKGFGNGTPATGVDADRLKRLRDTVARQIAEDQKRNARGEMQTAASQPKHGSALVNAGFAYVTYGEFAKGIALMEQGLQQAGSSKPQFDKLHLGIAYMLAGRKAEAIGMFKTVTGVHGAGDLGRLWYIYALRSSMN